MLILTGEVVLAGECLKKFQVRFVVLLRLRLSPWAYASSATRSASSLRLWFSFPSVFVDFHFFVATLNGHSRDFVVPQLLTHHRYMSVHVQVLVLAIWIFVVFRCSAESSSSTVNGSWITSGCIGGTGGVCGTGIGGVCAACA